MSARPTSPKMILPAKPYLGLSRYRYADAPVYAGRDEELNECVKQLDDTQCRLLLLHGASANGKSSFVEAGLVPMILRLNGVLAPALLDPRGGRYAIRLGLRPMSAIARALSDWTSGGESRAATARAARRRDLCPTVEEVLNAVFAIGVARGPKQLLILDQAEDVFSSTDPLGRKETEEYFRFMAHFTVEPVYCKLLIVMRSEWKARFDDELRLHSGDTSKVRTFFLRSMGPAGLREAILRPTNSTPYKTIGGERLVPRDKYQFEYDDDVVELMLKDLSQLNGKYLLPTMQVMCDRLFSHLRKNGRRVTEALYRSSGACSSQLAAYAEERVVVCLQGQTANVSGLADQVDRWRLALSEMAHHLQDGRTTARLFVSDKEFRQIARSHGCVAYARMVSHLGARTNPVLERVQGAVAGKGGQMGYRLVHDALARALWEWKEEEYLGVGNNSASRAEASERDAWRVKELFPTIPSTTEVRTMNDMIWDHQIMLYAERRGFTRRLSLKLATEREYDLTVRDYAHFNKFLSATATSDPPRVAVLPPSLYSNILEEPWTTIGIPNVYRGYAIVGRDRSDIRPLKVESGDSRVAKRRAREALRVLAKRLAAKDCRIGLYEAGCADFVRCLIAMGGEKEESPLEAVVLPNGAKPGYAIDPMFIALVNGEKDFAVGPAPSRALAAQAGFRVFADFEDVYRIATAKERQALDALFMHEVMVVDRGRSNEALLMRLAAALFYTIECIQRDPESFVRYVYDETARVGTTSPYPLQRRFIRTALRECYRYSETLNYLTDYCGPCSPYRFAASEKMRVHSVYMTWLDYRRKYDRSLIRLIESPRLAQLSVRRRKLVQMADRQYRIRNYYDAHRLLQMVERGADL